MKTYFCYPKTNLKHCKDYIFCNKGYHLQKKINKSEQRKNKDGQNSRQKRSIKNYIADDEMEKT